VSNGVEARANVSIAGRPPQLPVPWKSKCGPGRGITVIGGRGVIGPDNLQLPVNVTDDADAGTARAPAAASAARVPTARLNLVRGG
jgi:hypothetical protein